MSQSLLRNLLKAGIDANLTKNEWGCYAALLIQTLGYGKRTDALTTKRIAKVANIRKDRAELAIASLLGKGLMDAAEHKVFDWAYSIPARFFDGEPTARFFAPDLPKFGGFSRNSEDFSEIRIHTDTNHYRDSTLTDNTHAPAAEVVCGVDFDVDVKRPQAMTESDWSALLPALRKLPNTQRVDVLALTSAAISNGSIRTTVQKFAGGLIKAAQAGTLDTSGLRVMASAGSTSGRAACPAPAVEASNQAQEVAHLRRMAEQAGIPLECLLPKTKNPATAATVPGEAMIPTTSKSLENQYAT